jgi:thiol-disulfide isomerase/thioredoxin
MRNRLVAFGLLLLGLSAFGSRLSAQDIGLELGTQGPPAEMQTFDGKTVNLSQWIGKKPIMLEFWAAWCGNCSQLEPHLKAMHAKYGAQVEFVGIAVTFNQSVNRAKAYVERHQLPGTWLFDHKGNAGGAYDAPATSYIVVLDKAGKVVYTGLGGEQNLDEALKKATGN